MSRIVNEFGYPYDEYEDDDYDDDFEDDCEKEPRMDEYIGRKALIDAINETTWHHVGMDGKLVYGAHSMEDALFKAKDIYDAIDNIESDDNHKTAQAETILEFVHLLKETFRAKSVKDQIFSFDFYPMIGIIERTATEFIERRL